MPETGAGSELRLRAVSIKHTKEHKGLKTEGKMDKNTQEAPCHCDKRIIHEQSGGGTFNPSPQEEAEVGE